MSKVSYNCLKLKCHFVSFLVYLSGISRMKNQKSLNDYYSILCLFLFFKIKCFSHAKVSPIFGHHLVVLLPIVHLLLGFRRLREIDYYRDDPLVLRLLGLRKLPDVSTVSRAFSQMEDDDVENHRALSRDMVTEGLIRERFRLPY